MKKIITLLVAFGAFIAVQAQTPRDEARRVILGQPKNGGTNGRDVILGGSHDNTNGSRQAEIDRVNRDYDAKIYSIRNNPNLTQAEKERMIAQLERDRRRRINEINKAYDGRNDDRYDRRRRDRDRDYDDDDDRYEGRKDRGRHLGWERGVGNPHKNGGKPGKGYKQKKSKNKEYRDRDDD